MVKEVRGICPVCEKPVYMGEIHTTVGEEYYHWACYQTIPKVYRVVRPESFTRIIKRFCSEYVEPTILPQLCERPEIDVDELFNSVMTLDTTIKDPIKFMESLEMQLNHPSLYAWWSKWWLLIGIAGNRRIFSEAGVHPQKTVKKPIVKRVTPVKSISTAKISDYIISNFREEVIDLTFDELWIKHRREIYKLFGTEIKTLKITPEDIRKEIYG